MPVQFDYTSIKDRILNIFKQLPLTNAYSGELSMYINHPRHGRSFRYASAPHHQ
jgi:hypothetical protein